MYINIHVCIYTGMRICMPVSMSCMLTYLCIYINMLVRECVCINITEIKLQYSRLYYKHMLCSFSPHSLSHALSLILTLSTATVLFYHHTLYFLYVNIVRVHTYVHTFTCIYICMDICVLVSVCR